MILLLKETVNEKVKVEESAEVDEEVDGLPITDECLDGVPTSANDPNSNLDVDGDPLDGDALDGVPCKHQIVSKFSSFY